MEEKINHLDRLAYAMKVLAHDLKIIEKPEFEYKDIPDEVADKIIQRIVLDIIRNDHGQKENLFIPFYTCFEMGTELGMANRKGDYDFEGYEFNYSYKSMMELLRGSSIDITFQMIFNSQMERVKTLFGKMEYFNAMAASMSDEDKRGLHEILYVLFYCSMMIGYDYSRQYFNSITTKGV